MDLTKLPSDEEIGANVRVARTAAGMSQAALATQLGEEFGLRFSQQTLVKIEKGERSLKLAEAAAISEVLGLRFLDLLLAYETSPAEMHAIQISKTLGRAWSELVNAALRFKRLHKSLAKHLEESQLSEKQLARSVAPDRRAMLSLSVTEIFEAIFDPELARSRGLQPLEPSGRLMFDAEGETRNDQ